MNEFEVEVKVTEPEVPVELFATLRICWPSYVTVALPPKLIFTVIVVELLVVALQL